MPSGAAPGCLLRGAKCLASQKKIAPAAPGCRICHELATYHPKSLKWLYVAHTRQLYAKVWPRHKNFSGMEKDVANAWQLRDLRGYHVNPVLPRTFRNCHKIATPHSILESRFTRSLKVIWSFGKGLGIFQENSHLFDFHMKAYYVCIAPHEIHLKMHGA